MEVNQEKATFGVKGGLFGGDKCYNIDGNYIDVDLLAYLEIILIS